MHPLNIDLIRRNASFEVRELNQKNAKDNIKSVKEISTESGTRFEVTYNEAGGVERTKTLKYDPTKTKTKTKPMT